MIFWMIIKYFLLYPYLLICALITYYIHNEEKQYYEPLYVTKSQKSSDEKENKNINVSIHDEFPCFCKKDKPRNIIFLYIGVVFLGIPRLIIKLFLVWRMIKIMTEYAKSKKDKNNTDKDEINFRIKITKEQTSLYLRLAGLTIINRRLPDNIVLPVYQKYFGPDYKIDYDSKFCCYISNHTCVYDMVISMALFGTGFVAKGALTNAPFIKTLLKCLGSLFVDRSDKNSKDNILDLIMDRQKDYYQGKAVMPFMIFPEGTTTNGRYILKFKKGTFVTLLPLKATFIHPNLSQDFHMGVGSSDAACNYLISLSRFSNQVEYVELPIITPNDYMFEKFAHLGKEKWEIYAEVTREIMCELGGFKKHDFGVRDSYRYCSCITKKAFLERESYKIE